MKRQEVLDLIARQRPGWSLEAAFYESEEIFSLDRSWMAREWFLIGHVSELAEADSYIVRELLGESVIVTRDSQDVIRAFYNVCRHRGSRICHEDGRRNTLMCPYHAWTYRLDGTLRRAMAMSPDIDLGQMSLVPVQVREVAGLILASLTGEAAEIDAWAAAKGDLLRYQGVNKARIAARERFEIAGNWKLVIENALECYHCLPAHPEYCSIMRHVDAYTKSDGSGDLTWRKQVSLWKSTLADPDHPGAAERWPIGAGWKTQSKDGKPVAPLMGLQTRFDGGICGVGGMPFFSSMLLNDHAVLIQILPRAPGNTVLIFDWLTAASAREEEIDVTRMRWLWEATTLQDKKIIEDNAAGVRSAGYRPGPYSTLEDSTKGFVTFYLNELRAFLTEQPKTAMLDRDFNPQLAVEPV